MGKIFDAIEKFENEASRSKPKGTKTIYSELPEAKIASGNSIVASKPRFYSRSDKNLITYNDPLSYESEQFKILRTMLLFPQSGKRARTIMVTSALPGEGKSFVASNLAVSMAQNINEHVLLIDGDIRKPSLHNIFGFPDAPGLSEHLSKGIPLPDLLLKTMVKKLTLLPGGTPPPNPAELLSSNSMSDLIQETKNRYSDRYILLDTPPPKMTAETAAMSRQVDGILLVIKSESTPKKMVEDLIGLLGKEKILGVVMNHNNIQGSKYYGYGKYGKYGTYGKKK